MLSVWDYCHLDPSFVEEFEHLQEDLLEFHTTSPSTTNKDFFHQSSSSTPSTIPSSSSASKHTTTIPSNVENQIIVQNTTSQGIGLMTLSHCAEINDACRQSLESLDSVLLMIQDVKSAYFDVTGRTNSLVQKCETLLDQQVSFFNFFDCFNFNLILIFIFFNDFLLLLIAYITKYCRSITKDIKTL